MTQQQLASVLSELSKECRSVSSESDYTKLIQKYDMVFIGEKMNIINTQELCVTLSKCFGFSISLDELNRMVPTVCGSIGMKCMPEFSLDCPNPNIPYCYSITLW